MRKQLKIKVSLTSPFILPDLRTRWFWKVEHHFATTNFYSEYLSIINSIPLLLFQCNFWKSRHRKGVPFPKKRPEFLLVAIILNPYELELIGFISNVSEFTGYDY